MNEKSLMRKKKAELLEILAGLGENPSPKALKKDLVTLILRAGKTPEPSSKPKPEKKVKKATRNKRSSAAAKARVPTGKDAEENVRTAQREVEEAKFVTEPPRKPDKPEAEQAAPIAESTGPEQAAPAPHGEAESCESPREPELPQVYGADRITAIWRDPDWLFVYWEITPQGLEAARREAGSADTKTILRVYDVTGVEFASRDAPRHFDIEISDDAGNWYVNTGEPGRTFRVDVGLLGPEGAFHAIARSNPVAMPRATASEETDVRWMSSESEFERVYALSGGPQVGHTAAGSLFSFGG